MTEHPTATALLDAAEREFAAVGVEAASVRAIMRTAGADSGAVHYHFGTRDDLVQAVVDRLLEPLQARRLALLAGLGAQAVLGDVVAALVRPDLEAVLDVRDRDPAAGHVLAAIYLRPTPFVRDRVESSFRPVADRFLPHLVRAVPDVAPDELSWRVRWVVFGTLGAWLAEEARTFRPEHLEHELARLVASLAGALAASPAPATMPAPSPPTDRSRNSRSAP